MNIDDDETRRGDRAAWQHARDCGRFRLLSDEQVQKLILVQLYTAEDVDNRPGVPESEMLALCAWAESTLLDWGLLQNVIAGTTYVRMVDGSPEFSLTPKGMTEGLEIAEQLGLPRLWDKP